MITKNSERRLERCLASIYRNIPVRKLIVVDGYSTDRTLDILRGFNSRYKNIKIIQDDGTRATARQKGIENVETNWFVFVDSDIELCKNWFEKAIEYIDKDVGAIWGIEVWSVIKNPTMLKMFLWVTRKIFEVRGGTHDLLVRREAIEGIQIPCDLHVFEDAYIKGWITTKNYKVVACYDPCCLHHRPPRVWTLKGSLNTIMDALRFGTFKLIAGLMLSYGFYTAYTVYRIMLKKAIHH